MKELKVFFLTVLSPLILNCQTAKCVYKPKLIKMEKVEISPAPVHRNTYPKLIRMDKNHDGIINQYDNAPPPSFKNFKEVLYSYTEYLNRYQKYDEEYSNYLEKDINKNEMIDDFEESIDRLKRERRIDACINTLNEKRNENSITQYQMLAALFYLYNYTGDTSKAEKIALNLALKFPESNYELLRHISRKADAYWYDYHFSPRDTRYLLSFILMKSILAYIHFSSDSIHIIEENMNRIFPYFFVSRNFMLKFISKLQYDLHCRTEELELLEKKTKDSRQRESVEKEKKNFYESFDNLDIFYAYITKLHSLPSYHSDIVNKFKGEIKKYLRKNPGIKIKNYSDALSFIKKYIAEKRIPNSQYHFLIGGIFKLLISNYKPAKETDILLGPDQMFKRGYGVCTEQSLAMSVFLSDLLKSRESNLYLWFRKSYWHHISMIYKNSDDRYYILDNYGINRSSFSTLKKAIGFHCATSSEYLISQSITSDKMNNKSWYKVEIGEKSFITSSDDRYTITFSKRESCE